MWSLRGWTTVSLMALAVACPGDLDGQELVGRIVDARSGRPVPSATIRLHRTEAEGAVISAVAASDGSFVIRAPTAGSYRVTIEAPGYAQEVPNRLFLAQGVTHIVVVAAIDAIRMEAVTVEARARSSRLDAAGFYGRMQHEVGRFIERAEIEERDPRRITDLLRGIAGLRVVESGNRSDIVMRGGRMGSMGGGLSANNRTADALCAPEIYIDGQVVSRGGSVTQARDFPRHDLNEILPARVEAIEVYASAARVPVRFGGSHAACGVVLFWTR